MSDGHAPSLSFSRWIWCYFRGLSSNRLEGTIPDAISTLMKLTGLCAFTSFLFSVGFVRLSLTFSKKNATGNSTEMPWRAQSRLKYQLWPIWTSCMPKIWLNLLSVGHVFIECWSCAASLRFSSFFFSQVARFQCLDGHNPTTNLNVDQAVGSVCSELDPNYWVLAIYFIECWSCTPLSHTFNFFLPQGPRNQCLDGPNPVWNINIDQACLPVCR